MKTKFLLVLMMIGSIIFWPDDAALAQTGVLHGTETPAVYDDREKILQRQDALERRQLQKQVAGMYRNMIAAYKAGRTTYFQEQSAQFDRLLKDPRLSRRYAEKMRGKYQQFLAKVDVELTEETQKSGTDSSCPVASLASQNSDADAAVPKHHVKISVRDAVAPDTLRLSDEERQQRQADQLLAYQKNMLELERAEVDRYVALYQQELSETRRQMKEGFDAKIESLYQDGLEYFDHKAYRFAFDILTAVEQLKPDYKLTRRYLENLERYFSSQTSLESIEN